MAISFLTAFTPLTDLAMLSAVLFSMALLAKPDSITVPFSVSTLIDEAATSLSCNNHRRCKLGRQAVGAETLGNLFFGTFGVIWINAGEFFERPNGISAAFERVSTCGASVTMAMRTQVPYVPWRTDRMGRRRSEILETIAIILVVLWLLGLVSSYTMGGFIHALLVIAVVVILVRVIRGGRR